VRAHDRKLAQLFGASPEASRKKGFDAVCVSDSGLFWTAWSVLTLEPMLQSVNYL
jgi:hypothetical protein